MPGRIDQRGFGVGALVNVGEQLDVDRCVQRDGLRDVVHAAQASLRIVIEAGTRLGRMVQETGAAHDAHRNGVDAYLVGRPLDAEARREVLVYRSSGRGMGDTDGATPMTVPMLTIDPACFRAIHSRAAACITYQVP